MHDTKPVMKLKSHVTSILLRAFYVVCFSCLKLPGLLFSVCFSSVSKTNLAVHEDRNRVPYVKVC